MKKKHLDKLIEIGKEDIVYIGSNSLSWAKSVIKNSKEIDVLLNKTFERKELLHYCNNSKCTNLNVSLAILSWGGMRRDHGRLLFSKKSSALDNLVTRLRENKYLTRRLAFEDFQAERKLGNLPGLGIGYYTKLIFFLSPSLNGYIMDQWVSKSINLLTGKSIVSLNSNSWVNDKNSPEDYDIFCECVDELSKILNCSGAEAEERIFSIGHNKGKWRRYLIDSYKNAIV